MPTAAPSTCWHYLMKIVNILIGENTMKYDFTSIIDRQGKDSIAVDVIPFDNAEVAEGFSKIPMWVADMNFATVPTIQDAIIERAKHPAFGYFDPRMAEHTQRCGRPDKGSYRL